MRWILVLLFALSSATAVAQPAPAKQAMQREKIKQRIRAQRAYMLTNQLQLDQATAEKLFPLLAKYDAQFDKLLDERLDLQRRLNGAGAMKDTQAVNKLIDQAIANQRALWNTEENRLAELRKMLTPAQTARVLIVLPEMERRILNQLRKAVARQKAPRQGPADPYGDDDRE